MILSVRALILGLALVSALPSPAKAQETLAGPIRSRNHHPIFMNLLNPPPEDPRLKSALSWEIGLNHSSVFAMRSNDAWYIHMDKEVTETHFSFRAPAAQGKLEIGGEMALAVSSGGLLDPLVRSYHNAIGVPGYDWQDHFPSGFYVDKMYNKYDIFYLGRKDALLPADATFWLKGQAAETGSALLAWQVFLQAPTGAAGQGMGSGFWEYGGRALGRLAYPGLGVYSSLGVYIPNRLKGLGTSVPLAPIYSAFGGLEWTLWDGWAFLAQFTYTSSPFAGRGNDFFSKPWIDSTFGFKKIIGPNKTVGLGISENLNQTAPDFTIHASLAM